MGFLSTLAIANLMELSHKTVYNWEHGRSIPGDRSCRLIAEIMGTSENKVRRMVGRLPRVGGDEVFPGVKPVLPCSPPHSKPDSNPTIPQQTALEGSIGLCECGERMERDVIRCEWCKKDWGYREYLRWCVREGRVLSTLVLSYRMKARGYFRSNGWAAREVR